MLKEKYEDLLNYAEELNLRIEEVKEEDGNLHLNGVAEYQLDKNLFWDKIKTFDNWEDEVKANITVNNTDVYGYYVVKSGDSLSKIAKNLLEDANRFNEIFELNQDQLSNPDLIKVGQKLEIPKK